MKLPNTFLIGAAKSGTSALAKALGSHPQVFVAESKEPFYFAYPGKKPNWTGPGDSTEFVVENFNAYCALYQDATDHKAVLDASTGYLYSASAAQNVCEFNKKARIIAILRQPADRAFSAFMHVRHRTVAELEDFREALRLEGERIAAGYEHLWHYRAMGLYSEQLERWFSKFPRQQIKVLLYDEFIDSPEKTYKDICEFLGLDGQALLNVRDRVNESRVPRSKLLHGFLWSNNRAKKAMAKFLPERFRKSLWNLNLHRTSFSPEIRDELTRFFIPDIKKLQKLIGQDLSHWMK